LIVNNNFKVGCDLTVKNFLIIKLGDVNEVLLSTPLVKILKEEYPDCHITYVVGDEAQQVVQGNPYLDQVIVFEESRFEHIREEKNIFKAKKALNPVKNRLKDRKYDVVFDLENKKRTHYLAFRASARKRILMGEAWSAFFYTKKLEPDPELHLTEDYLRLLREIGIEVDNYPVEFAIGSSGQKKQYIDSLLGKHGIHKGDLVVVMNPVANEKDDGWPRENFVDVGNWVVEEAGGRVVIIGNKGREQQTIQVASRIQGRVLNLTGQLDHQELGELLRKTTALITGNCLLVQFAMAVNTPVLGLFEEEVPGRVGPYGGRNLILKSGTGDVRDIGVETVIDNLSTMLTWE
jgi:ADP-heptose:LPS heptosyltransferase